MSRDLVVYSFVLTSVMSLAYKEAYTLFAKCSYHIFCKVPLPYLLQSALTISPLVTAHHMDLMNSSFYTDLACLSNPPHVPLPTSQFHTSPTLYPRILPPYTITVLHIHTPSKISDVIPNMPSTSKKQEIELALSTFTQFLSARHDAECPICYLA